MKLRPARFCLSAALVLAGLARSLSAAVTTVSVPFSVSHGVSISTGAISILGSSANSSTSAPASLSFPQFSAASGTLTSVAITIVTDVASNSGVAKTGLLSLLSNASYGSTLKANVSAGTVTKSAQNTATVSGGSLLSLLALSGTQQTPAASLNTTITVTDPVELMAFIGSGTVSTSLTADDTVNITTLASVLSGVGISTSGTYSGHVDVSYVYTPAVVATSPSIGSQPAGVTVSNGGTISLSVTASGTAPFTYQWSKNLLPISGATSSTLTINNASLLDSASYTVVVTNSAGSVTSSPAVVVVLAAPVAGTAPTITSQPSPVSISVGGTVSLSVAASGTAPFTYQWSKNGSVVSGATATTLSIPNASLLDSGIYSVVVTNSAGSATSSPATVVVLALPSGNSAPTITSQPSPVSISVGGTVSLSVAASGTAPFTYQWSKNGAAVSGASAATLSIPNASLLDSGIYTVTVTNSAGSTTSSPAAVVVLALPSGNGAPSITSQPSPVTLSTGGTISLSVGASGTGPFTYQWSKTGTAIAGATASTLTINSATITDSGSYTVVVTNLIGSATSTPAVVLVLAPPATPTAPTIGSQPVSQTVSAGSSVTFTIGVSGTAPFTYQWRKDGAAISGATSASLALTNVQTSNNGGYSVVVTSPLGSITSLTAQLSVQASSSGNTGTGVPVIFASPLSTSAVVGSNVGFSVGATGASLSYQWLKDGVAILSATNATYSISNVQPKHAGDYSVIVQNTLGAVISSAATLSVTGTATAADVPPAHLVNLSTRSMVGTGADVLIGGFVIGGSSAQTLLIRAVGPSLADLGLAGVLADPKLTIYKDGKVVIANDDWSIPADRAVISQMATSSGAFPLKANSKDAAVVATLQPGAYTVVVEGASEDTGTGLIELYNMSTQMNTALGNDIVNLSSRGRVGADGNVVIAGFVVGGDSPKNMLIRGVGPSLTKLGVGDVLANPKITIYRGSTVVKENDDWETGNDAAAVRRVSQAVGAFPLDAGSKDAVMLIALEPGTYTAIISGQDNTQGVALVEIYQAP